MLTIAILGIVCGFLFSVTPLFGSFGDPPPAADDFPVTILHDRTETCLRVQAGTVADALRTAGIAVDPDDIVAPDAATPITGSTTVCVVRVTRTILREEVVLTAPRTMVPSVRLRPGRAVVIERGRDGKVVREFEVTCYDGVERSRKLLTEALVTSPRSHVIAVSARTLASRHGAARRTLTMVATAYSAEQGGIKNSTSIGLRTGQGAVAVDPSIIPLGTRLYIDGYGLAIAADTGGAIKGRRIDLGFDTLREARRFGRRKVTVYILD
jgi:3D (Asp-Asp-Asp) domain-containing protein